MKECLLLTSLFCLFALYVASEKKIQAMVDTLRFERIALYGQRDRYKIVKLDVNQISKEIDEFSAKIELLTGSDGQLKSEAQLKKDLADLKAKQTTLVGLLTELEIKLE